VIRYLSSPAARSVNQKATIASWRDPVGEQVDDALQNRLGLPGACRGDDLPVAAAVTDRLAGRTGEIRRLARHRA
jgi:hypothetical protein